MTASALKGDRETCLAAGCTAYLTKPIKQDVLLQAIKDYAAAGVPTLDDPSDPRTQRLTEKLAKQIPAYLENCRHNVAVMQEALGRSDFGAVTTIGHNLRGSGGGFGFQKISDLGAALEKASEDSDAGGASRLLSELSSYLDGLQTAK